jgi:signal-transduction protein with cAMP-binding, CBS, and nucleotidyltransferase domain
MRCCEGARLLCLTCSFPNQLQVLTWVVWCGQITEKTPLDRVIEMFRALGIRYLLVTQNGQLVGILKKKDILEHIELYRKGLSDRRQDTL